MSRAVNVALSSWGQNTVKITETEHKHILINSTFQPNNDLKKLFKILKFGLGVLSSLQIAMAK